MSGQEHEAAAGAVKLLDEARRWNWLTIAAGIIEGSLPASAFDTEGLVRELRRLAAASDEGTP